MKIKDYLRGENISLEQLGEVEVNATRPARTDDPPKIQAWADPLELEISVSLEGIAYD